MKWKWSKKGAKLCQLRKLLLVCHFFLGPKCLKQTHNSKSRKKSYNSWKGVTISALDIIPSHTQQSLFYALCMTNSFCLLSTVSLSFFLMTLCSSDKNSSTRIQDKFIQVPAYSRKKKKKFWKEWSKRLSYLWVEKVLWVFENEKLEKDY